MIKYPTMTYANLIEKYPNAKKDIEIMREEKNSAVNVALFAVSIVCLSLGFIIGRVI